MGDLFSDFCEVTVDEGELTEREPRYRLESRRPDGEGWLGARTPKTWAEWYDQLGRGFTLRVVRLTLEGAPEGEPPAFEGLAKDMPEAPPEADRGAS